MGLDWGDLRWVRGFLDREADLRWCPGFPDIPVDPRWVDWDTEGGRDDFGWLEAVGLDTRVALPARSADFDTEDDPVDPYPCLGLPMVRDFLDTPVGRLGARWDTALCPDGRPAFGLWGASSPPLVLPAQGLDMVWDSLGPSAVPRVAFLKPRGREVWEVWARVRSLAPAGVFPP